MSEHSLPKWIERLTEIGAKEILAEIVYELDELDQDDGISTEGWREAWNIDAGRN